MEGFQRKWGASWENWGGFGVCGGKLGVWWKNGDFYRKMRV